MESVILVYLPQGQKPGFQLPSLCCWDGKGARAPKDSPGARLALAVFPTGSASGQSRPANEVDATREANRQLVPQLACRLTLCYESAVVDLDRQQVSSHCASFALLPPL